MNDDIERRAKNIFEKFSINEKKKELAELEKKTYDSSFWKNTVNASETLKKISSLKKEIDDIEMIELLMEEKSYKDVEEYLEKYENLLFLSGEYDKCNIIFAIHAGQGGTEAMDWGSMLL